MPTWKFSLMSQVPVEESAGDHIFVFLRPPKPSRNLQLVAWQDCNPSFDSVYHFTLTDSIQVNVVGGGSRNSDNVTSNTIEIQPGQLAIVDNPNLNQSPFIEAPQKSAGQPGSSLTPNQAGIINKTDPFSRLTAQWMVNGNTAVVDHGPAMEGGISVFELDQSLYFLAAEPTIVGPDYILQDFEELSRATQYILPAGVSDIKVTWNRINGVDQFTFDPPSLDMLRAA